MTALSIMVPILLIGAIFLVIIIYRAIYRKNMNRALDGEATTGLIDIGSLLSAIAIIALIIMNIVSLTRINDLSYQVSYSESNLLSRISTLQSQYWSLSSSMEEYYQSQELVQSRKYDLVDIDLANELYTYDIEFTLLEKETSAEVYLVVEQNGVSENTLLSSSSLTYSHSIELEDNTSEYTISVLIEGDNLIQKELFIIRVNIDSENIVPVLFGFGESVENYYTILYVPEELYLVEGVNVESVVFKSYSDDVLIKTDTVSSTVDMETFLAPYIFEDDYWEYEEGSMFAMIYEHDGSQLIVEIIITLTNGTVLTRTREF